MLFSEAPIYDDLETLKLADGLSMFVTEAGADNELVVKVLDGKSPRDRAAELIQGSRLKDVAVRRELAKGGKAAIAASKDPMIQLALLVDGPAGRPAARWRSRSTSRCGRPTRRSPRRGSPCWAPRSIRTPPSRSAWPSAW